MKWQGSGSISTSWMVIQIKLKSKIWIRIKVKSRIRIRIIIKKLRGSGSATLPGDGMMVRLWGFPSARMLSSPAMMLKKGISKSEDSMVWQKVNQDTFVK